jgi:hypothetical protein
VSVAFLFAHIEEVCIGERVEQDLRVKRAASELAHARWDRLSREERLQQLQPLHRARRTKALARRKGAGHDAA